jgi:hypothetical protein
MPALMAILAIEQASMPLILMVLGIIKAHVNATGTFPSEEQIIAAIPIKAEAIKDLWAAWDKTHPS